MDLFYLVPSIIAKIIAEIISIIRPFIVLLVTDFALQN